MYSGNIYEYPGIVDADEDVPRQPATKKKKETVVPGRLFCGNRGASVVGRL